MCSNFLFMLSIFYGKIMTWSVTTKSFTQRTQSSNILQPDTLFREYRFIENRNSHNLFVSRELPLLCYLQSSPSLSLLSSAAVLKQVVPDSAEKVLCTRLCWHLLEWRIKEKGVNFQAGAQKKKGTTQGKGNTCASKGLFVPQLKLLSEP